MAGLLAGEVELAGVQEWLRRTEFIPLKRFKRIEIRSTTLMR